ncbi:MAG: ATP-binding cassette domain-containing protein [Paracoccus sp. (in: a-proteobacteria)]|nr:ATP-binding cassette domain-containing protein [Paracoccus sp. (in: a-proteobacteria)]
MSGAEISFENVGKHWPGAARPALENVSLRVAAGSITGIIGRSGAGKSTLLRMANGLERPDCGTVTVGGTDVGGANAQDLRAIRRGIGMIFQHFNLLASRTAAANVALPLEIAGVARAEVAPRVARRLDLVGLSDQAGLYPAQLSGGQKQRVGIARALATNPRVLLSDEATSALDPETTRSVLGLLRDINRELGLTIVLITHEMAVVREICTHVAVIEAGRIVETGETYSVFSRPAHEVTRSFLKGVTGVELPRFIAGRLQPTPAREAVVRITFTGPHATDPMLAGLTADLGITVNLLAGAIEEIGDNPFGNMIVSLDASRHDEARAWLERHGLMTEVLGYVA